jgi:hypothetical protein
MPITTMTMKVNNVFICNGGGLWTMDRGPFKTFRF